MSSDIAIGAGLAAMGVLGPALGVGLVAFKALEGMARQPESANRLFIFGLVFAALCEGLGIVSWLVANNLADKIS